MIRIDDLLKSIGADVERAYEYLRRRGKIELAEVEVELNLEVELAGEEEREIVDGKPVRRLIADRRLLLRRGISFRRISTVHGPAKTNLRLRATFLPGEE